MVEVYSSGIKTRFYASRFSIAYLFRVAWYIAIAIAPIYIAYATGRFWSKDDTYYEQPRVEFTKDVLFVGWANNGSRLFQYSTRDKWNQVLGYELVRIPTIKSWCTDQNQDTLCDIFNLDAVIPLEAGESLVGMDAYLFFQVHLDGTTKLSMSNMVHLSHDGGRIGQSWQYWGDLKMSQRNPLPSVGGRRTEYIDSLIVDSDLNVISDLDEALFVEEQMNRNESLVVERPVSLWNYNRIIQSRRRVQEVNSREETSPAYVSADNEASIYKATTASNSNSLLTLTSPAFYLSIRLYIPTSVIWYIPGPAESIKFAFIQWLAIFWFLYFFMKFIRHFVYTHQIVETSRIQDGIKSMLQKKQF